MARSRNLCNTLVVQALRTGMQSLRDTHGDLDTTFGTMFRAGRLDYDDSISYPVGGGSLRAEGMATLRAGA